MRKETRRVTRRVTRRQIFFSSARRKMKREMENTKRKENPKFKN